uniref:Transmembrane protein n=1 Tax=Neobodo designis TaxID=312471 RepID=A0A7S1W2P2_NEODS|mmetsp:Transcript_5041/g.15929  ORF Transcript_5041/g.15929 Transcript_5041/m.15929 type:complete len:244 (+) Transcript_5041:47-778(+)|eukprot:CAMPEP_0174853792 /NCGR_PEP_ID=MMETSP1114-20130205/29571_1 /TAXON_ID=312471 /ORGANISM="Neobodo designis, Strain CCAP 1951/1" /LENGTH=243 /DNA_ID=CAMNT_0016088459 /DNA_START=45 /DNA_END=776 /DNA_ORIENTATION=+
MATRRHRGAHPRSADASGGDALSIASQDDGAMHSHAGGPSGLDDIDVEVGSDAVELRQRAAAAGGLGETERAALTAQRQRDLEAARAGPPNQTPQFWLGVVIGACLSVLVVPFALWLWSASNPERVILPVGAAGSTPITRRRALYFGVLLGAGCSTAVIGVALSIYVLAATKWSLFVLCATVPACVVGPIVAFRGIAGWANLKRKYRMKSYDLWALGLLAFMAVIGLLVFMIHLLVDGLSHAM